MASDDEIKLKLSLKGADQFRRDARKVGDSIKYIAEQSRRADRYVRNLAAGLNQLTNRTRAYDRAARDAQRSANQLQRQVERLRRELDRALASQRRLGSATQNTTRHMSIMSRTLGTGRTAMSGFATASLTAGAALGTAGAAATLFGLKTYSEMENASVAFETMLGSADAAQAHIKAMKDFAFNTPFQYSDVEQYSAQLIAFGYNAQQSLKIMKSIGDASAGLGMGAEGLNRLTTVIGQIKAKGRVQSDELLQLYEARIPALDILSQASGKSKAKVQADVTAGIVPAQQAIDAILSYMDKKYGGLMDKQSKTLGGLWSNFVERTKFASADAVTPLAQALEQILPTAATAAGKGIGLLGRGLGWMVNQGRRAVPFLKELGGAYKLGGMDLVVNQIDNKLGAKGVLLDTWLKIKSIGEQVGRFWTTTLWPFLKAAAPVVLNLVHSIATGVDLFLKALGTVSPVLLPPLKYLLDIVRDTIYYTDRLLTRLDQAGGISAVVTGQTTEGDFTPEGKVTGQGAAKIAFSSLNPVNMVRGLIPGQANGGITRRPGLSWVGERGPELLHMPRGAQVTPLDTGPMQGLLKQRGDIILQAGAIQVSGANLLDNRRAAKAIVAQFKDMAARQ